MAIQKNVTRLEIAMEHPLFVGIMNGACDLHYEGRTLPRMFEQRMPRLQQTAGRRIFHRVIRKAVRRFSDVINRHDVWMLEPGGGLGLPSKPRFGVIAVAIANENALQCDDASGIRLPRL